MENFLPNKLANTAFEQKAAKYKQLLKSLTFTAIDFETANERPSSACAIGFVRVVEGQITEKGYFLIYPGSHKVNSRNFLIHGISDKQLEGAPKFEEVWVKLCPLIEEQIVVSHNSSFDINVLEQTAESNFIYTPDFRYMCSHRLVQEAFPDIINFRLSDCADYFGLELFHHNALSDAMVCAEITLKSLKSGNDFGIDCYNSDITSHIKKKKSAEKVDRYLSSMVSHKKIASDLLKPNLEVENKLHPFFNKKIVFTGDLKTIKRQQAAAKVQALGADIDTGIGKSTNIVIMGDKAGPSKLKKIEELIAKGNEIQIIYEEKFLKMC